MKCTIYKWIKCLMMAAQSKTDFSQSECCSFGLITRRAWVSWFLWQPKVRWPGYVLPSCSCGINRLFVNRMAKHSLTRFQVHRVWGNWVKGQRLKVISHFGPVLLWNLAAFQTEVLEIVHTQAFCQKTTESWLRQDSITKFFLSLSLSVWILPSEIYKNARNF